jgi:hypothetical protein
VTNRETGGGLNGGYQVNATTVSDDAFLDTLTGASGADPNQVYELALAQVLQAANGNSDFVGQDLLWSLPGLYPLLP